jgi:nicotinamide mononucleotide adenylyltransferase
VPALMVHGRFQPFHNEHLEYVREGLRRTDRFLVVGITNPFPAAAPEKAVSADDHRHEAAANPFSFLERARMVQLSLHGVGEDLSRVLVLPFRLDALESVAWLTETVVQLVNLLDGWDAEKCHLFRDAGFEVHTYQRKRSISGSEVRRRLDDGLSVAHLLPRGTLEVLHSGL